MDHLDALRRTAADLAKATQRHDDALRAAYVDGGHSLRELGEALGLTKEATAGRLRRLGVELRSRGRSPGAS